MSEDYYSVKVRYGSDSTLAYHMREKELDRGVTAIYGYNKVWGEWRIVELRFKKYVFPNLAAVEAYLEKRKGEVIRLLGAGQYNSRIKTEIQMLLAISRAKYLSEVRLEGNIAW